MIIDGKNLIVGRAATYAAKQALKGEKVDIINCEKMVITGKRDFLLSEYVRRKKMGVPTKGPYRSRLPTYLVRRIIRGMLPYKQPRGKEAYLRVKCHVGTGAVKGEAITLEFADVKKVPNLDFTTVEEISKRLGWHQK